MGKRPNFRVNEDVIEMYREAVKDKHGKIRHEAGDQLEEIMLEWSEKVLNDGYDEHRDSGNTEVLNEIADDVRDIKDRLDASPPTGVSQREEKEIISGGHDNNHKSSSNTNQSESQTETDDGEDSPWLLAEYDPDTHEDVSKDKLEDFHYYLKDGGDVPESFELQAKHVTSNKVINNRETQVELVLALLRYHAPGNIRQKKVTNIVRSVWDSDYYLDYSDDTSLVSKIWSRLHRSDAIDGRTISKEVVEQAEKEAREEERREKQADISNHVNEIEAIVADIDDVTTVSDRDKIIRGVENQTRVEDIDEWFDDEEAAELVKRQEAVFGNIDSLKRQMNEQIWEDLKTRVEVVSTVSDRDNICKRARQVNADSEDIDDLREQMNDQIRDNLSSEVKQVADDVQEAAEAFDVSDCCNIGIVNRSRTEVHEIASEVVDSEWADESARSVFDNLAIDTSEIDETLESVDNAADERIETIKQNDLARHVEDMDIMDKEDFDPSTGLGIAGDEDMIHHPNLSVASGDGISGIIRFETSDSLADFEDSDNINGFSDIQEHVHPREVARCLVHVVDEDDIVAMLRTMRDDGDNPLPAKNGTTMMGAIGEDVHDELVNTVIPEETDISLDETERMLDNADL